MSTTIPQYPWSEGDPLFASALNAAIASGGGYGSIRGSDDQNLGAGGSFQGYTTFASAISGVRVDGDAQLSLIRTTADTLDAGAGGLIGQFIDFKSGGAGTSGNRVGQYIQTRFTGSTLDKTRGYPSQYGGQWIYAYASGNAGGTSTSDIRGALWGGLASAVLQAGATYWAQCIGFEVNVGVGSGATAGYVQGLKVVVGNHTQAPQVTDYLIGLAKYQISDQGMMTGISFGSYDGYWPIAPVGTLIGTQGSNLPTPPAMAATNGIDFSAVTFSGAAFKSSGFLISRTGGIDFQDGVASGATDLSRHIRFHISGYGFSLTSGSLNCVAGSQTAFYIGGALMATFDPNGLSVSSAMTAVSHVVGSVGGPSWTTGGAVPSSIQPVGSLYSRVGGTVGATLYVSRGGGTWAAVAAV